MSPLQAHRRRHQGPVLSAVVREAAEIRHRRPRPRHGVRAPLHRQRAEWPALQQALPERGRWGNTHTLSLAVRGSVSGPVAMEPGWIVNERFQQRGRKKQRGVRNRRYHRWSTTREPGQDGSVAFGKKMFSFQTDLQVFIFHISPGKSVCISQSATPVGRQVNRCSLTRHFLRFKVEEQKISLKKTWQSVNYLSHLWSQKWPKCVFVTFKDTLNHRLLYFLKFFGFNI